MTEIKDWLIGEFRRTGCRHESMKDAMACSKCGENFKRVERIYNQKVKANPELVKRPEPKRVLSAKGAEMYNAMEFRLKNDPMYKWHLKTLAQGTASEKKKEWERWESGYYKKHNDFNLGKWR